MDEDLHLDGAARGDEADLLGGKLAREDDPAHAELRRGVDPGEIMDGHLGAGVQRKIGADAAQHAREPEVLHQHGVRPRVGHEAPKLRRLLHLAVAHEGVHRDINAAAALVAVAQRVYKFLLGKIFRAPAGVEAAEPQINGVRPVLNGGDNSLRASGRG